MNSGKGRIHKKCFPTPDGLSGWNFEEKRNWHIANCRMSLSVLAVVLMVPAELGLVLQTLFLLSWKMAKLRTNFLQMKGENSVTSCVLC